MGNSTSGENLERNIVDEKAKNACEILNLDGSIVQYLSNTNFTEHTAKIMFTIHGFDITIRLTSRDNYLSFVLKSEYTEKLGGKIPFLWPYITEISKHEFGNNTKNINIFFLDTHLDPLITQLRNILPELAT